MKIWAHHPGGTVREIIELPDGLAPGKDIFLPSFAADLTDVTALSPQPTVGWTTADSGKTFAAPAVPAVDLTAYAKAKRDATEAGGITVNGVAIASDIDSQNRVNNAYNGMVVSGVASIPFKSASGFVTLTLDQLKAIGTALFNHTQACFAAEDQVDAALAASPPTVATTAQVDAIFAAVKSAY
ncbi:MULTISPECIES: DUF4376 domain-containing protein [unclassified Methylobacterium]|uniref:DUF4376 domain-containing protein n=1 Tax=unclassified Methylobacterium TaxID=2615210 RepID=UPI0022698E04|nr:MULTISPECIES: DUF4376 domain-containing protein [unclassified Methylobacterium]